MADGHTHLRNYHHDHYRNLISSLSASFFGADSGDDDGGGSSGSTASGRGVNGGVDVDPRLAVAVSGAVALLAAVALVPLLDVAGRRRVRGLI